MSTWGLDSQGKRIKWFERNESPADVEEILLVWFPHQSPNNFLYEGSAEQHFQILDHFMGKFNDPAIMLQLLSVLSLLWNSQDFGSFHMSKFKQIQFGALNQGTIGSAHLLQCVVMYLWIQLLTRSAMTTHKASSWESSRKKTLQLYHTFSLNVTVFLELHATFSIVTVAGWKLLAKEAEPLCAELLVSCGTALSTLAIQSNPIIRGGAFLLYSIQKYFSDHPISHTLEGFSWQIMNGHAGEAMLIMMGSPLTDLLHLHIMSQRRKWQLPTHALCGRSIKTFT